MMLILSLILGMWLQSAPAPGATAADAKSVAAVEALYAAAAYEDAIALVSSLEVADITLEHERYRALCLFALGRSKDAEASLERVVRRAPVFTIAEADVSPRFMTMFREVRRRVLPGIARERYGEGKRLYEEQRFADAASVLKGVQSLLGDPELSQPADAFADLRQLTDGFVRLAELEIAQASKAVAPPRNPIATVPDLVVTKIAVYSAENPEVTPPVEIERFMPPWTPPAAMARAKQEYRGELEVIVDETGRVQQARMLRPTVPSYDLTLTNATRRWRFEPAMRAGQPVKYVLTFQIVLAPAAQRR